MDAAPSERPKKIAKETTSWDAATAGALGGAKRGSLVGSFCSGAGNVVCGFIGSKNEETPQPEPSEQTNNVQIIPEDFDLNNPNTWRCLPDDYEIPYDIKHSFNHAHQLSEERGSIILSPHLDVCSKLKFSINSINKIFLDHEGNLILISKQGTTNVSGCSIDENNFLIFF